MDRKESEKLLDLIKLSVCKCCVHERCEIDKNLPDDEFIDKVRFLAWEMLESKKKELE